MDKKVYYLIKQEYEQRQEKAFDDYLSKKESLYSTVPQVELIDQKIKTLGLKLSKMVLENSAVDKSLILSEIENLKKAKQKLLVKNKYPSNFLEKEYQCKLCNDTGYVYKNGSFVKCSCYTQLLISHLHRQSNLNMVEFENFSSFESNLFSPSPCENENSKISPRENILSIKKMCTDFVENFSSPNVRNLFFSGPTGVGKTFMCNCIAFELLNKSKTVLCQSASSLFNTIYEHKFRLYKDDDYNNAVYSNIFNVELLIIDDLGTELNNSSRYTNLLSILNARNNFSGKITKTIISSNLGARELHHYYDERTASRIVGSFDMLKFFGHDLRKVKKFKEKNRAI